VDMRCRRHLSRAIEDLAVVMATPRSRVSSPSAFNSRDQFGFAPRCRRPAGKLARHALDDNDVPAAPIEHDAGQQPLIEPPTITARRPLVMG